MESIIDQMSEDDIEEINNRLAERLVDAGIDEQEVLESARRDLKSWDAYFGENMVRGREDMNFLLRDQWSARERSEFTRLLKPAMTFNKLYDPIKKILGEQRNNKPDLMVRSLNGNANQKQIDLRADLVRTISYRSQNDLIYQNAFKLALMYGYGAFEIELDYENPRSFNQNAEYKLVLDSSLASFDPRAIKPHKADGNYCALKIMYSKEEFFATYPHVTQPVSYDDPSLLLGFEWETKDSIVVCKYTRKEWFPIKLYLLDNGKTATEEQWEEIQKKIKLKENLAVSSQVVGDIILKDIPRIVGERQSKDYRIRQYLLTQNKVIEFADWPSKYLPMIYVDGDSNFINGQQFTRSFIHDAKDSQKFINYVGSEIAAEIKNRRREQWMGTADNIVGEEQMWRNPELQTGILIARPDTKTGAMPVKMPQWELSQTLLQQYQRGSQDIREITGFSESEALQGRDMSGKARRERKLEGSMSAAIWYDNLKQAVEQGGRVILDLLPVIVGEFERPMIISKPDGRTESIVLNKRKGEDENGNPIIENMLDDGDYDIEIDAGPSFAVQKEIAIEFMQETVQANPQVFNLIADLWAKNLDVQFMPQMADRLKTLVPPAIIAQEEGKPPPPPPPPSPEEQMAQAQLQQQQQALEMNAQKMKIEEQQILERAEELKIRKEKHLLEQAEMIMKSQEMKEKRALERKKLGIESERLLSEDKRAEQDFAAKLAQVLSSIHKKSE